jgi:hypothetical protein
MWVLELMAKIRFAQAKEILYIFVEIIAVSEYDLYEL